MYYHGSSHKIEKFSNEHIGTGNDANSALGIFFSKKENVARIFAETYKVLNDVEEAYVYACKIKEFKPYYMDSYDEYYGDELEETKTKEWFEDLREDLLEQGYTVVVDNFSEDEMVVVLDEKFIEIVAYSKVK